MHHWVPLLDHFDAFLEAYIKGRVDLTLEYGDPADASSSPQQPGAAAPQQPPPQPPQQPSPQPPQPQQAAELPPFPTQAVLEILRVTTLLLEGCSNKHLYNSYEVSSTAVQQYG